MSMTDIARNRKSAGLKENFIKDEYTIGKTIKKVLPKEDL